MTMWNRRQVIKAGGTAAVVSAGGPLARPALAESTEPHFFLQVVASDGWDVSYIFDARPLAMTEAGKSANYLGETPSVWRGGNGQTTLSTRVVDPLRPYADRFSVLNGVLMAPSFDGHDQNMNQFLTGNPFGGESFIPHL